MKHSNKRSAFLGLALLCSAGLVACGQTTDSSTGASNSEEAPVQTFCMVTSKDWDAYVQYGESEPVDDLNTKQMGYKYAVDLKKDNTVAFNLYSCEINVETATSENTVKTELSRTLVSTTSGKWELEAGYGYTITLDDTAKTVLHTDYNTITGRHTFYYTATLPDKAPSQYTFQAKDNKFRNSLASDYQIYAARHARYTFTGEGTGNNSTVALAYIYLVDDNTAFCDQPNGANRDITIGTWSINEATHALSITLGGKQVAADYCDIAGREGYRVAYNSNIHYCSVNNTVSYTEYTSEDFDGTTIYLFQDARNNVEFRLTNKLAVRYKSNKLSGSGTWTFENDVFTVTFTGEEPKTSVHNEDGTYSITWEEVSSNSSGETRTEYNLVYTPAE